MSEEKKKSWFSRHKILTALICLFVLVGIFGAIFGENTSNTGDIVNEQNNQQGKDNVIQLNGATNKDSTIIKKDPLDLLPTREEIDTEWENIERNDQTIESQGFDSGAGLQMDRMEGLSLSMGSILIGKFNSVNDAKNYYNKEVKRIKDEGGYTEISTSDINANCFAYKGGDYVAGYYSLALCQKQNMYFVSEIDSFNTFRLNYYKDLAKIVANKI